jgi:5-oxoprolinase (ATP-hydrolysing)
VREQNATTVIEPGWRATLTPRDHIVLDARRSGAARARDRHHRRPVLLEVFNNLFMAIAEQMGVTLANTAYSVNIKERLDFLVRAVRRRRQASSPTRPHMPVHLGSMGESVKTIIDRRGATMHRGTSSC